LIPMRNLGREYFHFDPDSATLMGSESGMVIGLGQRVTVKLVEAAPVTGGIALELLTIEDQEMPKGGRGDRRGRGSKRPTGRKGPKGKPPSKRKLDRAKQKKAKIKVTRQKRG
ncbi:MAG: ribonuclease R, partial [Pseudomonadota bacterium]|nr:ribonuclease R [Pseudomonadota bacterium]